EGSAITIIGDRQRRRSTAHDETAVPAAADLGDPLVVLDVTDHSASDTLLSAAYADRIKVLEARSRGDILPAIEEKTPSLIILERKEGRPDPLKFCKNLRAHEATRDIPVIVVADIEDPEAGTAAGVTDWLIRPFSSAYARTRIRAWLLRTRIRWARPPLPPDEEQRLATLHSLNILDTPAEQRFDRLTRLAAGILGVQVALVSLADP